MVHVVAQQYLLWSKKKTTTNQLLLSIKDNFDSMEVAPFGKQEGLNSSFYYLVLMIKRTIERIPNHRILDSEINLLIDLISRVIPCQIKENKAWREALRTQKPFNEHLRSIFMAIKRERNLSQQFKRISEYMMHIAKHYDACIDCQTNDDFMRFRKFIRKMWKQQKICVY